MSLKQLQEEAVKEFEKTLFVQDYDSSYEMKKADAVFFIKTMVAHAIKVFAEETKLPEKKFPQRESDEYDAGYLYAVQCHEKLKQDFINN